MANLGNPTNTIAVLQKYEFMFQKKFGQNFLIDEHVLEKIIRAAGVTKDDFVFTNDYIPVGKFTVNGDKEITKRDWRNGDSFVFELYTADSNWVIDNTVAPLTQTVSYNAQGDYSFTFEDIIIS